MRLEMRRHNSNVARYALCAAVLITANANRIKSGLLTAWVFHIIGNSFLLLLPELFNRLEWVLAPSKSSAEGGSLRSMVEGVIDEVVVDNTRYVEYVA